MLKKRKYLICRDGKSPEQRPIIAREIALLKILEKLISTAIPHIDQCYPYSYAFFYEPLKGTELTPELYVALSRKQKSLLAKDLATFIYELHRAIPSQFANAIGFTSTPWPLSPETLKEQVLPTLDEYHHPFFEYFLKIYQETITKEVEPVLLHHDLHGKNILVHKKSGRLKGILDFEDAALGDPYQEFRLLYTIDAHLMEETASFYAQMTRHRFNIQRIHVYYLATEYSRLAETIQGKKTEHTTEDIMRRIREYEYTYYGKIPSRCRVPLDYYGE